jgi:predicted aconitase
MLHLEPHHQAILAGAAGEARALAMRVVCETARMLGASKLIPIVSAHIDGCLYHGDSGTLFAERLVADGGQVAVPTTLNVGALDLLHPGLERMTPDRRAMARRMMDAYVRLGCRQTWTCAPYQAGHRPSKGQQVAWGESNAVAFCNSVLGARTERYGDFLDICAALCGFVPYVGLHRDEARVASVAIRCETLDERLTREDALYPVLGAWLGAEVGSDVAAFAGLPSALSEDRLKALGAAAASSGSVGLFHVVGTTPEAPETTIAFGGQRPRQEIVLTGGMLRTARDRLSSQGVASGSDIDAVAIGSPHLSTAEFHRLRQLLAGRRCRLPFYACTGRHTLDEIERDGTLAQVRDAGVTVVADTCIVVTPILPANRGLLLTNSGKFAHYTKPNTGYDVLYGSLSDCVETAFAGRLVRDEALWR